MDSLTQIILGAAVGEVCLGKKIGNRAMLWGGIAGTIPDLDVISNLWMDPLNALCFHRSITHSLFFAVVFSFLLAWLVKRYYDSNLYTKKGIRVLSSVLASLAILSFFGGLASVSYFLNLGGFWMTLAFALLPGFGIYVVYRTWKHYGLATSLFDVKIDFKTWYWFFFLTIFTHPILDCFTVFGTQLFAPFSDYRVAWNNVAVADPAYTLPFGILLIITSFYSRESAKRHYWRLATILVSSTYMLFTLANKFYINSIVEKSAKAEGINYSRYMTNPSILNNVLWSGTLETDSFYFQGSYSWFDKEQKFKWNKVAKNHQLLGDGKDNDYTINRLRWFSNDYYSILQRKDGRLQLNDMRYGLFNSMNKDYGEDDFIFKFILSKKADGKYELVKDAGGPPKGREKEMMGLLYNRIKGI